MLCCIFLILSTWLLHNFAEATMCLTGYDIQLACLGCCHGIPLNHYEDIQSVLLCSNLCSGDPECRSWQFNPDNNECWTNAERMSPVNTSCTKHVRYGESREATCRKHMMYDPCTSDADCPLANSTCRSGMCDCKDGHPYDSRTDSCPAGCTEYGNTLHEASYYLEFSSDEIGAAFEHCLSACLSATRYVCRYIALHIVNGHCMTNENNAVSHPIYVAKLQPDTKWKAWDRNCA